MISDISSPSALGTSAGDWYNSVVRPDSSGKSLEVLTTVGGSWVDVRDISLAHVLALQKAEAGGERLMISAGEFVFQDFSEAFIILLFLAEFQLNIIPSSRRSQLAVALTHPFAL